MGRRVLALPDQTVLMQDAAMLLAETLDADLSVIALVSADGRSLSMRLIPTGTPENPAVAETSCSARDSLAGHALQVAHPIFVDDLGGEERFEDPFLRGHGVQSAIAVPLKLYDRAHGALAVCSTAPRRFDSSDVLFVETIAHLVSAAIARSQAEESLAEQSRLAAGVLDTVNALVLLLDPQWRIVNLNAACRRVTGYTLEEVKLHPLWSVFDVVGDQGPLAAVREQFDNGAQRAECEALLFSKHAAERRVAWTCGLIKAKDGTPTGIIAAGIDVTTLLEAEDKARCAEQAMDAMRCMIAGDAARSAGTAADPLAPNGGQDAAQPFAAMPATLHAERRTRPRRSYPYSQMIAPVVDGQLPDLGEFVEVRCNDIAAGGFSYISPTPPSHEMLVVALGVLPKVTHLIAQVAHVTRTEEEGRRVYLVGCSYIGRANYL